MGNGIKKDLQTLVSKTFVERYETVCQAVGVSPVSESAELRIGHGITKGTISSWATKGTVPRAETVYAIAKAFGVSADYLLGLSDEMRPSKTAATVSVLPVLDLVSESIVDQMSKLDKEDKEKVKEFIAFLLSNDKYQKKEKQA